MKKPKKKRPRKIADVIQRLDELAPFDTAEKWDNVGLLVGSPDWDTDGAVISVDLTAEVLSVAKRQKFGLIVNHHPCIFPGFRNLSRLTTVRDDPAALIFQAVQQRTAVVSCHTNFDKCSIEVVDKVAVGLGFTPLGRFHELSTSNLMKLVTFVPVSHLSSVRRAVNDVGAGHIGNYDSCGFAVEGEGTFRGGEMTKPFCGQIGRLERTREIRFETVFPRGLEKMVLRTLVKSHPYEEVAYDLYSVEQSPSVRGLVRGLGYGVWGDFPSPRPFSEISKDVKRLFNIDRFWLTDPPPSQVKRVGFVAGKGSSFVSSAASLECDLFITGEAGYHAALNGLRRGTAVMEIGHRESEIFFRLTMEKWLADLGMRAVNLDLPSQKIY